MCLHRQKHMKKLLLFLFIGLFCAHVPCAGQTDGATHLADDSVAMEASDSLWWPQNIQAQLQELMTDPLLETTQLGLCVYDLTADSLLFAHGQRQLLRPASTQKVVTAVAALAELGGSHLFETNFYHTGVVEDTLLRGDLYLVGGFDPAFGHDDMKAFMHALTALGVRRIEGQIYADRTFKDTLRWGSGWCWDDKATRLTPLLFGGRDCFETAFFEALAEEGITADSLIREKRLPAEGVRLIANRFHTMDQILMHMMKDSDNLYAEAMFYQLAAKSGRSYAGAKEAAGYVKALIRRLGFDPDHYRIADGSGLSLYNYVSAELLVALLRHAYRDNQISLHLWPSLPRAGVDGTLERRMKRGCAYDHIYAKTGTLTGVSSLAGYAKAANGHVLAFAIINQGIRRNAQGHRFQDRVCELLTIP